MAEVGQVKAREDGRKFQRSEECMVISHPRANQKKCLRTHSELAGLSPRGEADFSRAVPEPTVETYALLHCGKGLPSVC